MTTILDITVIGTPRPKGSMRHIGHGRMIEQLAGSPDWRIAVAKEAFATISDGCGKLRTGYPSLAALEVKATLTVTRPKSVRGEHARPSTRSSGDIDKHARNLLDALQDAQVMKDDAQVVLLAIGKRYCGPGEIPGARITVSEMGAV